MLYKVPKLNNEELQDLFFVETRKLKDALDRNLAHNQILAIRNTISIIVDELEKRRKDGRIKDS